VRLVSIEPAHEKGQVKVKLQIGAIATRPSSNFFRALENSPAFREVREDREMSSTPSHSDDLDRLQVQLTVVYARS